MDRALLFVLLAGGVFLAARARQHSRQMKRGPSSSATSETVDLGIEGSDQDRTVLMSPGSQLVVRGAQPSGTQWSLTVASGGQTVDVTERSLPLPVPGMTQVEYTIRAVARGSGQLMFVLLDDQNQMRASANFLIEVE